MKSNSIKPDLEKEKYQKNIKKFYAFRFFKGLHLFAGVLVPFFTIWGGISFTQVMILQAIFTFSIFLLEIPTGAIADFFGRKTSLVIGAVVTAIAAAAYAIYPNFWVFVAAEVLWALGGALLSGADHALVYDSLKELDKESSSKKVFGRMSSIGLMAIAIAAPIGSLIAEAINLRATMFLSAVPMLAAAGIALTFKEPEIGRKKKKEKYLKTIKEGINYFRRHKELRTLTFDYVPIAVLAFFMIWTYQVVLEKFAVSIALFGLVHAGITIVEIIVLNNFVSLEKIFNGKRNYLYFSAFIVGGGFILVALAPNVYIALAGISLISAFGLTRRPLYQNYLNKFIESTNRATVLSTISMIYSFTMAISNIIFGRLVDWNLEITLIIIGGLILALAAASKLEEGLLRD
ncbi:MFS transporter [Candidatus Woesearchaeota archaeon]|jgi:MFS family permease|nr:MFS transporter [Candidatus Woesearchaeota archaeon]